MKIYNKNTVNNFPVRIKKILSLVPDMFEGEDSEKLTKALNYAISSNTDAVIVLNRIYDVTGTTVWIEKDSCVRKRIIVSNGGIKKDDTGFVFDSKNKKINNISLFFKESTFITNIWDKEVYLINGDSLQIPIDYDMCKFDKIGCVKAERGVVENLKIHNSETGYLNCDFIKCKKIRTSLLEHNRHESSASYTTRLVNVVNDLDSTPSHIGLRIVNTLIEGFVYTPPIYISGGIGFLCDGNYHECNSNGSVEIVSTEKGYNYIQGVFKTCVFAFLKEGKYHLTIDENINAEHFFVENNISNHNAGTYFCSKPLPNMKNNYWYIKGGSAPTSIPPKYSIISSQEHEQKQENGVTYRVPINFEEGRIFLCNAKMTYGSSVWYSAHATFILTIDSSLDETGAPVQKINYSMLQTRNTSSNVNGNVNNPTKITLSFESTGTEYLDMNENSGVVLINFPSCKYYANNTFTIKNLNNILGLFPDKII